MRSLALILATVAILAAADPAPRQLDPRQPGDAVVIIDQLTRQTSLPREQAVALTMAIDTLAKLAQADADTKAKAAEPKPADHPPAPAKKD